MRLFLFNILLILNFGLFSQNLVIDGSFEDYYKCPESMGWFYLNSWTSIKSPDYFNECDSNNQKFMNVPKNIGGFQYPVTGVGYAGFYVFQLYNNQQEAGEFIQTKLINSLKNGKCYNLYFRVSIQNKASNYAIQDFGGFFSKNDLLNEIFADTIIPQIVNKKGIIDDSLVWNTIKGSFIANGNEQYLTLGNFFIKRSVKFKVYPHGPTNTKAFYYIDAVAVYPCDAPISTAKTINDTLICKGNKINPGKTKVEGKYKIEYQWLWYKVGNEEDTLSVKEFPVFQPDTTTSYVLKLTDFKYDITYDTVTVSVADCKQPTSLNVYPNPTNDVVYFAFDSPIPKGLSIELYNLMGQKVKGISYKPNKENKLVDLNLQTLPTGIYFYRVLMEDEVNFSGKIIKI